MKITSIHRSLAWKRIAGYALSLIVSALLAWLVGGYLPNSADVVVMLATVFSIIAAAVIAVISILGDPAMIIDQSWRTSYINAAETQRKIQRHTDIFVLYVVIIIALFAFMLVDKSASWFWVAQRLSFFLVCVGFIAALQLPYALKSIQRQRLEAAIASKKGDRT